MTETLNKEHYNIDGHEVPRFESEIKESVFHSEIKTFISTCHLSTIIITIVVLTTMKNKFMFLRPITTNKCVKSM